MIKCFARCAILYIFRTFCYSITTALLVVLAREPETVTPLDGSRSALKRTYAGFLLTRGDAISALTAYDLFILFSKLKSIEGDIEM